MKDQRKGIQSVEQGTKLLEALIDSRGPMPLKQLAAVAGMSASMAHRYLASFIRADLVRQDQVSGHYDLSTFALRLGLAALNRSDFIQVADDELKQLVSRVNVDGHLSVWGDYGVTIVRIHNRHIPILSNLRLGAVLPLYASAGGRLFLAHESRTTIKKVFKSELTQLEGPKPSASEIDTIVRSVKKDGFAWIDGQVVHSLRALAVPIFDMQGTLRAAMSLVSNQASLVQFPNDTLNDLIETGLRISKRLGWSDRA
jgi:DNA-binding IclR family transcriptional regulator